jgi:cell division protein ZipA
LGLVVLLGIYLWGKGIFRARKRAMESRHRAEPSLEPGADVVAPAAESSDEVLGIAPEPRRLAGTTRTHSGVVERKPSPRRMPEKIVALRLVAKDEPPTAETVVLALRRHGLEHGLYGIFHKVADGDVHNPLFSVARLTEPGSFDLSSLAETKIPGLSLFLALPGSGDPVTRFDDMIDTARALARELGSDLFDEKGSSWSVQRERFLREEMIQYRHHLEHG